LCVFLLQAPTATERVTDSDQLNLVIIDLVFGLSKFFETVQAASKKMTFTLKVVKIGSKNNLVCLSKPAVLNVGSPQSSNE